MVPTPEAKQIIQKLKGSASYMKRIGLLTSGGDCQGLNAALRGVAKALYEKFGSDAELYGIVDGYRGLIEGTYRLMKSEDFSGILNLGGTILGTSRQPFKMMRVIDENSVDKVSAMVSNYKKMKLDCLVVLGGNGTHKTANLLSEEGLNVVSMPKTIDNDIWGTDMTFGFQSAVDIAANVLDCIHTTATSHGRIFVVELMGHKAGWLTLHAGIAGSADAILLPEIPYRIDNVVKMLDRRASIGKQFSILAIAEGAISAEDAALSKKELKLKRAAETYPSVAYKLAKELQDKTGQEIRVTVPGHFQRGGSPCPYDRVLATRFGAAAADLIAKKQYGYMVALHGETIEPVPLGEVAGKLKLVPPACETVRQAKSIGVCFGD
jgi:6-phosphofructokinase